MGRPLNKRYFNSGAGDQIKVRAKIGANAEGDGVILRQKGSKHFLVQVGANSGLCTLADKANGALAAGDMTITVANDAGTANLRVMKITAKKATLANGTSQAWTFVTSTTDGELDMPEVADTPTITVQPSNASKTAPAAATFAVTATAATTITYQWQVSINGGTSYTNVVEGGAYAGSTTATLTIDPTDTGKTTYKYRCVVSSVGGSVTSDAATLTVA